MCAQERNLPNRGFPGISNEAPLKFRQLHASKMRALLRPGQGASAVAWGPVFPGFKVSPSAGEMFVVLQGMW